MVNWGTLTSSCFQNRRALEMAQHIRLRKESENALTAYLELPNHPHEAVSGCVSRTVDLDELLEYVGPKIYLDLDDKNQLIGIEVLASSSDD
jgi:hypothetical protein